MAALAFQPWPLVTPKKPALIDILSHISLERGHFRDITESSLQEELVAADGFSPSSSDSEEDEEETVSRPPTKVTPSTRHELYAVKTDMLRQLDEAQRQISDAVQFMSLLNSEHTAAAEKTLSKAYMGPVQKGTLGTDVWQRMDADYAREEQDRSLAQNVKMRSLQESADSLLGAAERLEVNVRKETEYWNQMLSISEKGWNVCRVSGRTNRLGVRFGFSEGAGEFAGRSVAALQTDSDGGISLERGVGVKPKGLRVSVVRQGQLVGRSYLPSVADGSETTLEARIRRARDSIFDEELHREMLTESRTMTSSGVRLRGSAIEIPSHTDLRASGDKIELDLVPLSGESGTQLNPDNPEDTLAQALALVCRLLLTQAHRERLKARSAIPPPLAERKLDKPVLAILHQVAAFLSHSTAITSVNTHVDEISHLLARAGIKSHVQHAKLQILTGGDIQGMDALAAAMKKPLTSTASLAVDAPDQDQAATLTMSIETSATRRTVTTFAITGWNEEGMEYESFEGAKTAIDSMVAMTLAQCLQMQAGPDWFCSNDEATLTKEADDRANVLRSEKLAISVGCGVLVMTLTDQSLEWSLDPNGGEKPPIGLWEAAQKYITG